MLTFYPFKNNRLGLYVGSGSSRHQVDYKKVMPFARSRALTIIFGIVFLIFGGIELNVLFETIELWGKADNLFGLTSAIFMSCWLLGWTIGVILLFIVFLAMLLGRGLLLIYHGRVEMHIGIPGMGIVIRQEASMVTSVELVEPHDKSVFPKEGKQLLISDGDSITITPIGSSMSLEDLESVRAAISLNKSRDSKLDPESDGFTPPLENDNAQKQTVTPEAEVSGSTIVLVLANLAPLLGALLFGWDLSEIMVLYWLETAVLLIYQIAKHATVSPWFGLLAGFFSVASIGGFMAIHFLFIWTLFVDKGFMSGQMSSSSLSEVFDYLALLWPAIVALIVSHGYSFYHNFWPQRKLYRQGTLKVKNLMERIVIMHVTLILGAFLVFATGQNVAGVLLLIVLKIIVDGIAHRKYNTRPPSPTV